jgi:hypothetical protein
MLQRIQTLFLLMAALADLLLFWLPVATLYPENGGEALPLRASHDWILTLLVVGSAVASLAAVGLYGNRPLQATVANVGLFAILAVAGYAAFLIFSSGPGYGLGLGLLLPLLSANLTAFAVKAIRKDEELVRSSERLR